MSRTYQSARPTRRQRLVLRMVCEAQPVASPLQTAALEPAQPIRRLAEAATPAAQPAHPLPKPHFRFAAKPLTSPQRR